MCRWTSRDTCYHFAPRGIFIAGANEPTGWWSIASRDNQWRGTQTDTRLQFSNERNTATRSRAVDTAGRHFPPVVSQRPGFQLFEYTRSIDEKVWHAPEENGQKKSAYDYSKIRFPKTFEKFETREIETIGRAGSASMVHSLLFFLCLMHCLNTTNHFRLFTVSQNVSVIEREAIKHCILHSALHDEITHALEL